MKKSALFIFILIAVFLIMPLSHSAARADSGAAYDFYYNFVTAHPNRTVATENEVAAADNIAAILENDCGYSDIEIDAFEFQEEVNYFYSVESETKNSQNVIAYKYCGIPDAKLLVIGTYYGNIVERALSTTEIVGGEGAYDNGTGVGALLAIAERLRETVLSFDIAFVFFGAEQLDYAGSRHFTSSTNREIFGMINIVKVGGGDKLYAYYDEVGRTHGAFLDTLIGRLGYDINSAPRNRNFIYSDSVNGLPYTHQGLEASNAIFMANGIPSVNIFGYNWGGAIGSESAKNLDIAKTAADTRDTLDELYGAETIRQKLETVTDFVVNAVTEEGFESNFAAAVNDNTMPHLTGKALQTSLKWILFAALIISFTLIMVRASKITANCPKEIINENAVNEDDIFTFGASLEDSGLEEGRIGNDEDDIFNEF